MELKQILEERGELIARIQSEEFEGNYADWDGDKRNAWDQVNQRVDELTEAKENAEGEIAVAQRRTELEDLEHRKSFVRKTEFGEYKANKLRVAVTEEHRALALQGWMFRQYDRGDLVTKSHQEAFHLMGGDFNSKWLTVRMGAGINRGFNVWSTKRGSGVDWTYYNEHIGEYLKEYRGPLDTQTANEGAEWVPAETFRAELIRFMIAFGPIRGVVRTITTNGGEPMRMPSGDDTGNEADIKAESTSAAPVSSDFVDPVTDDRTWGAYKYNSGVKWSFEMAQDSPLNLQSILAEYLGERMGRRQSKDFTTGDGVGKPNGIVTEASVVPGVNWELTPTNPYDNADALIDTQTSLDPAYEAAGNVGWMFNKTTLGGIRKLKDADGQYLWQPGLRAGEPDLLLGDNYVVNQSMPAIAANSRSILYGDFSSYIIRDAGAMRMRVLNELYAETDQIGMIVWYRSDGKCKRISTAITSDPSIKVLESSAT